MRKKTSSKRNDETDSALSKNSIFDETKEKRTPENTFICHIVMSINNVF